VLWDSLPEAWCDENMHGQPPNWNGWTSFRVFEIEGSPPNQGPSGILKYRLCFTFESRRPEVRSTGLLPEGGHIDGQRSRAANPEYTSHDQFLKQDEERLMRNAGDERDDLEERISSYSFREENIGMVPAAGMNSGLATTPCHVLYTNREGDVDLALSFLSTSRSTSSSETLSQARRWLSDCEKYHTLCSVPVWSARPPTRLLNIQHPDIVRLSTADHAGVVYATLSHCWGTSPILKLTTYSLKSFLEGVDISQFPKTFQHAIEVTRHLGIDHIWIDSCCIIQDSLDDWRTESGNVGAIYAGSRLNLAATDSSDSSGGLFRNREPGSLSPCKIYATETTFNTGEYYFLSPVPWTRDVRDARLNSRGWVFQERTLAPRGLHFAKSQVYWECRESLSWEALPEALRKPNPLGIEHHSQRELARLAEICSLGRQYIWPGGFRRLIYSTWNNFVHGYSRCNLTFETDRLVAISGLARLISSFLGDNETYLAGLFRGNLIRHLCWTSQTCTRAHLRSRPQAYIAPSWSWASILGPSFLGIELSDGATSEMAEVLDAETTPIGDPFGQVSHGYIRLRGRLFTCSTNRSLRLLFVDAEPRFNAQISFDAPIEQGTRLYCMPLLLEDFEIRRPEDAWMKELVSMKGIVLTPTGMVRGQFMRCGQFSTGSFWKANYEPLLAWCSIRRDQLECESFEDGLYTITVV
jgi:hypothetical protein